jgi:arylsulfatase A-like enzyme
LCDLFVGEILQRLEKEKLLDSTVTFFISDNGQCSHRGKQFLYEAGTHVPLIVRFPDKRRQAQGALPREIALFAGDTKPIEELYDLSKDPWEVSNLADLPEHNATLLQLRAVVDQWMRESNDQGGGHGGPRANPPGVLRQKSP